MLRRVVRVHPVTTVMSALPFATTTTWGDNLSLPFYDRADACTGIGIRDQTMQITRFCCRIMF
jgi:hypothetical protein